jgi:hypothetical protein
MSDFKKFYNRKMDELKNNSLCFRAQADMGTHPITSRQPAAFHFYLSILENMIPEVNRSEIIFEAIQSAYRDVMLNRDIPKSVQDKVDEVHGMLLNAWHGKCLKSASERQENETGFFASDESKAVSEEFISDWNENKLGYDGLISKYKNTHLEYANSDDEQE